MAHGGGARGSRPEVPALFEHDLETARATPEAAEEAVEMLPEFLIPVDDELLEEEKAAVGLRCSLRPGSCSPRPIRWADPADPDA